MRGAEASRARASLTLSLLVVIAAGALTACGGSKSAFTPSTPRSWPPGASPTPALSFPAGEILFKADVGDYGTTGWEFRPTLDIEVTALGYYDDKQDGLLHPHRVGIFDTADQKLLFSFTVQPQSALDGVYRWASVEPPGVLKAGHSYVVASEDGPSPYDPAVNKPAGQVWAPEILHGDLHALVGGWEYPDAGDTRYFIPTPNFKFKPVLVSSLTSAP